MDEVSTKPEQVTINKNEYDNLVLDQMLLDCLYAGGVDNWDGFGDALEEFIAARDA